MNPSQKIVEAAGDCWHEHPIQETSNNISDDHTFVECVKCGEDFVALELAPNLYPGLTDESNRGLLIEYVKRICVSPICQAKYIASLERVIGKPFRSVFDELYGSKQIFRLHTATAESICKALVEVIENEATVQ